MNLKDTMALDEKTFLCADEFASSYIIVMGGVSATVLGILDTDTTEKPIVSPEDGLELISHKLYVRGSDLPRTPQRGKEISVDGERYMVTDISREEGFCVLTLEVYDG